MTKGKPNKEVLVEGIRERFTTKEELDNKIEQILYKLAKLKEEKQQFVAEYGERINSINNVIEDSKRILEALAVVKYRLNKLHKENGE